MKCLTKLFLLILVFLIIVHAKNIVCSKTFSRPEELGILVELKTENTNLTINEEAIIKGIVKNLSNKSLNMRITIYSSQPSFKIIEMDPGWAEEKTLNPSEEIPIIIKLRFEKAGICELGLMIIMQDKIAASEPIVFNVREVPPSLVDVLLRVLPFIIIVSLLVSTIYIKRVRTVLNTVLFTCYSRILVHKDEASGHIIIFILLLLTLLLPMLPEEFVTRIFQTYLVLLLIGIPILAILDGFLYRRTWLSFTVMFMPFTIAGLIISSIPYFSLRAFLVYIYFGFIAGIMGLGSSLIMLKKKPINLIGVVVLVISIILWTLLIFPWFQNIHQIY